MSSTVFTVFHPSAYPRHVANPSSLGVRICTPRYYMPRSKIDAKWMGHEKYVVQLCFTALVRQIYVYSDECLLVKSTSFGSIVRDSNTIIVRWRTPLPRRLVGAIRRLLFILHADSDNRFYRKIIFNPFTDCTSLIIHAPPKDFSFAFCWWRYRITPRWKQRLIIVDVQKLLRKARFKARCPGVRKVAMMLLSWKYTGYYKNNVEIVANELQ